MSEIINVFNDVSFQDGGWVLWVPICLMCLDVLTGIVVAWKTGHLKSYKMREGLGRKCLEIIILLVGWVLTIGMNVPSVLLNAVSAYITFMELVSIVENCRKGGLQFPKFVDKAFEHVNEQLQNGIDDKKEDNDDGKTEDDSP